ncbi:hypothetical protein JQX13_38820 [Archangium violaceum]|uniref:hypothetical protein n=1 Tax=Archangium violaceum TaxID=83451 RepID=UPI00193C4A7D|nr:hypothetical protein [Archangium violaceum]QRK06037.1 hypothetical protein JQX13_38820 [Archangium violaceum]
MALQDLTSPDAVEAAIAEFDGLGRESFLEKYGFGRARSFFLVSDGKRYDSKAIAGVAFGYQFPERGPLSSSDFSGGEATVRAKLEELGFTVKDDTAPAAPRSSAPERIPGRVYSWDELGEMFGFRPSYLGRRGRMVPHRGAVLLITDPEGAKSFNCEDYWDGRDLIYTGRARVGDQGLGDFDFRIVKNLSTLFVFERAGTRKLRFLGVAECQQYWWTYGDDDSGERRRILRFRLRFKGTGPQRQLLQAGPEREQVNTIVEEPAAEPEVPLQTQQPAHREPRPFDESRRPAALTPSGERASPEETLALREKAVQNHHELLAALKRHLVAAGWDSIEEIPSAVDLWARAPLEGVRVIFEAKTLDPSNEVHQTRAALSQLLEYRHFRGAAADELCLVTNAPISDARERFLATMGVAVITYDGEGFQVSGALARPWLAEFASNR